MFLIARRAQGLASWTVKAVEGGMYVPGMHRKHSGNGRRSRIRGRSSRGVPRQVEEAFQVSANEGELRWQQ
jgi:hypothetical protein